MYKQPKTEVSAFETKLMQDIVTLSPQGGEGPGSTDAPARGGIIE